MGIVHNTVWDAARGELRPGFAKLIYIGGVFRGAWEVPTEDSTRLRLFGHALHQGYTRHPRTLQGIRSGWLQRSFNTAFDGVVARAVALTSWVSNVACTRQASCGWRRLRRRLHDVRLQVMLGVDDSASNSLSRTRRSRVRFPMAASVSEPAASALIACTTSASVASRSFPFSPRTTTAVRKTMRLFPSLNACALASPSA